MRSPRSKDHPHRREVIAHAVASCALLSTHPAWAQAVTNLGLPSGPNERELTRAFAEKGEMILQRTRPPLLETPFAVYDRGIFTPSDRFFVRWHLAAIPETVDVATYRLSVTGHVERDLSLSLEDVLSLPRFDIAAVNQCSGNSRGYVAPRVPGAQWGHGAMGNAKWTGVRLRDVLDRAGIKSGAVQVQFKGLDEGVVPETPVFRKSLDIDHARDGEVMIAYQMNGEQLPMLNGFPLRLVVPGWYSTYWVKMLDTITVLDKADENYWMKTAYRIPDTPRANVKPGEKGFKTVPINRMVPRSFFTNLAEGASMPHGKPSMVRGIAFGGDCGVESVELSTDGGTTWLQTTLGTDEGKYSFRSWQTSLTPTAVGRQVLMVRARNAAGVTQPDKPTWNGGGFMLNAIEATTIVVA
ncbi:molybdopterin-dependent oxidoreductase [Beijerinckia sp. L45]|uniref:molybdopterin-dependent oxidoreductase n=1 Tax=Beijerinckia sp. L45 TaxID=1641855 RepID=UPI00131B74CB|nr:molybdopterin-dependent oxidoreductase [Beijerinckia sp. L45]